MLYSKTLIYMSAYFARGSAVPTQTAPTEVYIRCQVNDCPYGTLCFRRRPYVAEGFHHICTDNPKPIAHWHIVGTWMHPPTKPDATVVIVTAPTPSVMVRRRTAIPGYLLQLSVAPVAGTCSHGRHMGDTICVDDIVPCPHGTRCYRKRWYVSEYYDSGEYGRRPIGQKPKIHWHIPIGAKWKDNNGLDIKSKEHFV